MDLSPDRYAICGMVPRFASRPESREQLIEIVRACAADGLTIVPWGGGVSLPEVARPERYDLALDLTGLSRLIEYEPEDLTLTVECGATLASLSARLAEQGQEFPLEGAFADRATVGGVLSSNASGPRRLRLGGPRDRILGARFVLGDGTRARAGGKVVKNVAGYGIHRMLIGARGTLAILVDASFKLLPAPAARLALIYNVDREWLERGEWRAVARWEPAVCTVVSAGLASEYKLPGSTPGPRQSNPANARPQTTRNTPYHVTLGFEDDAPRIAELRRMAIERLGEPLLELRDREVAGLWQQLADLEEARPMRLTFASAHNTPVGATAVFELEACDFALHAPCGRLHLFPATEPPPGILEGLDRAGFSLIGARGCDAVAARREAVALTRLRSRIRTALDPGARFALAGNQPPPRG